MFPSKINAPSFNPNREKPLSIDKGNDVQAQTFSFDWNDTGVETTKNQRAKFNDSSFKQSIRCSMQDDTSLDQIIDLLKKEDNCDHEADSLDRLLNSIESSDEKVFQESYLPKSDSFDSQLTTKQPSSCAKSQINPKQYSLNVPLANHQCRSENLVPKVIEFRDQKNKSGTDLFGSLGSQTFDFHQGYPKKIKTPETKPSDIFDTHKIYAWKCRVYTYVKNTAALLKNYETRIAYHQGRTNYNSFIQNPDMRLFVIADLMKQIQDVNKL